MKITKYLSVFTIITILVFVTGCSTINSLSTEIFSSSLAIEFENAIKDEQAVTGTLDIQANWEVFIKDKIDVKYELDYLTSSPLKLLDGDDAYTQEEYDSLVEYSKEYIKLLESLTKYDVGKVTGEFYGVLGSDDEVFPGVFIYKFENLPEELKLINYELINKIYNDFEIWALEDTDDAKMYYLQKGNYIINIMGEYCNDMDQIMKIVDEKIK